MCLDQLKKFKAPVYGYKIFKKNTIGLFSLFQGEYEPYPINKILDEKNFRTFYHKKQEHLYEYPYGFHIFQTLKSAKKKLNNMGYDDNVVWYSIYKVEIIEPHTTGLEVLNDSYCNVIVSKKMRIIKKIC